MKIQPIWTINDHNKEKGTRLYGQIVYCPSENFDPVDASYVVSTLHIIGYDPKLSRDFFTFTSLGDGSTNVYTLEKLIDILNKQPYAPIPHTIMIEAMKYKIPLV